MTLDEVLEYLKKVRKQYRSTFEEHILETYTDFPICKVSTLRHRSTLDKVENEILIGLHGLDEEMAKVKLTGAAFPATEGFLMVGNEHTYFILHGYTDAETVILKPLDFGGSLGFEEVVLPDQNLDNYLCILNPNYTGDAAVSVEQWWNDIKPKKDQS